MSELVSRLRAAGCVFAEEEAAQLLEAASGAALEQLVRRRLAGEPLEHVVGFVDFHGSRFAIGPGVFIPRQRSGLLVEEALRRGRPGAVVVDLCCGSGALGLAVHGVLGGRLVAADLDPVAVSCARANGVAQVFEGDLYDALPRDLAGRIDLLLANTPYVPTGAVAQMPAESREHEPRLSVDGGPDGMALQRRLLAAAPLWLAPGGHLLTETSTLQADRLVDLAAESGLAARVVHDRQRGATVVVARREKEIR